MRRGNASYICILVTIALVYFGSLYITARLSGSTTCFSIFHKEDDQHMQSVSRETQQQQQQQEEEAVVVCPPAPEPIVVKSPAACPSTQPPSASPSSNSTTASPDEVNRANAVIVILCRNSELLPMRRTMRELEEYVRSTRKKIHRTSNLIIV